MNGTFIRHVSGARLTLNEYPKSTQLLIVTVCFSFVVYAAPDGVRKLKLKKKDVVASSKAKEDREVAALILTCLCL
jgi:hypothetical protein